MLKAIDLFSKFSTYSTLRKGKLLTSALSEATLELEHPLLLEDWRGNETTPVSISPFSNIETDTARFSVPEENLVTLKQEKRPKRLDKGDDKDGLDSKVKSKNRRREKLKRGEEEDLETLGKPNLIAGTNTNSSIALSTARPQGGTEKKSSPALPPLKQTSSTKKNKKNKRNKNLESKELELEAPQEILLTNPIAVKDLAELLVTNETEVIRILFFKGITVTINQVIDVETAKLVCEELGVQIQTEQEETSLSEKREIQRTDDTPTETRPPIITIMGHVDHGKTTLLDRIRQTQVAQREAGGITQKLGAYEVEVPHKDEKRTLVFLDTPGHEAFSGMRSRGVQVTDLAVLIVAADDGVKPQTIEAIKYIQDAKVPVIVAINKIDKEDADPAQIQQQLAQHNLIPESWGGDVIMVPVSAKKGMNIDTLLETLVLVSDLENLQARVNSPAQGTVLESHVDRTKGAVATVLVREGTLKTGDIIATSGGIAKVRGMLNSQGDRIEAASPSSPALIWGLTKVPQAGEYFEAFETEREAKNALQDLQTQNENLTRTTSDVYNLASLTDRPILNLVIKTDIQGSVEAIIGTIAKMPQNRVQIRILYGSPGEVTETDIDFSYASGASVLAFNTTSAPGAQKLARHLGVEVREYDVIYDLFDDIDSMIEELVGPEYDEIAVGNATVKMVFPLAKSFVAGSIVTEGRLTSDCQLEVTRKKEVVYRGPISSLKHLKESVNEILEGSECGVFIEDFDTWEEGDSIRAFTLSPKKKQK
nr:translation initiation factor 2 [Proteomonas sp. NIES-1005]